MATRTFGLTLAGGSGAAWAAARLCHHQAPLIYGLPLTAVAALGLTSYRLSRQSERWDLEQGPLGPHTLQPAPQPSYSTRPSSAFVPAWPPDVGGVRWVTAAGPTSDTHVFGAPVQAEALRRGAKPRRPRSTPYSRAASAKATHRTELWAQPLASTSGSHPQPSQGRAIKTAGTPIAASCASPQATPIADVVHEEPGRRVMRDTCKTPAVSVVRPPSPVAVPKRVQATSQGSQVSQSLPTFARLTDALWQQAKSHMPLTQSADLFRPRTAQTTQRRQEADAARAEHQAREQAWHRSTDAAEVLIMPQLDADAVLLPGGVMGSASSMSSAGASLRSLTTTPDLSLAASSHGSDLSETLGPSARDDAPRSAYTPPLP